MGTAASKDTDKVLQAVTEDTRYVITTIKAWKDDSDVVIPTEVDSSMKICGEVEKIISASGRQRHAGDPFKLLKSFARKLSSLRKRMENLNKKKAKSLTKALKNRTTKKSFTEFVSDTDAYITQYRSELDVANNERRADGEASASGGNAPNMLGDAFWDKTFPGLKMVEWGSFLQAYKAKYPDSLVEQLAPAYGMTKAASIFSRSLFDDAVSDHGFPFVITEESLARVKPQNRRTGGIKSVFEKQVSNILQVDIYKVIASGDEQRAREYLRQHPDAVHDRNGPRNGTPLHVAAFYGLDGMVQLLLEHGADPSKKNIDGATPFDAAAQQNHLSTVKLLYPRTKNPGLHFATLGGAHDVIEYVTGLQPDDEARSEMVNRQRKDGTAPLHVAAEQGHVNCAVALVRAGADVDLEDEYGRTAVRVAADNDQAMMLAKLRDLGADMDVQDQNGHTALMAAVVDGNLDTFEALLRHGADPHAEGFDSETVAHYLSRREDDHADFVAALRRYEADLNAQDKYLRTPLVHAALTRNRGAAEALLQGGADPTRADETGNTPLTVAATQNDVPMVRTLLAGGAPVNQTTSEDDPDAVLSPPLCYANNTETVTVLLEAGANPNLTDQHGRIAAVYHVHDPEVVRKLVSDDIPHRLRIGKRCQDGRTVLHFAAPFEDSLRTLLEEAGTTDFSVERNFDGLGGFVNAADASGRTALHEAAAKGTAESVRALQDTGVLDAAARDGAGNTALHAASAAGNASTIPSVVGAAPAVLNAQNAAGETALHVAARDPTGAAAAALLEQDGVDHQVRDAGGRTAHHVAFERANEGAMAHLGDRAMRDAGAQAGEVEVGLVWYNYNDLDLTVVCPHGQRIFFRERTAPCCGGTLDVDENVDPKSDTPSEHVRWDAGAAPGARDGVYRVYVIHFANHAQRQSAIPNLPERCRDPTQFLVSVKKDGQDVIRAAGALSFLPLVTPPPDHWVAGARNKTHMLAISFRWAHGQPLSDVWINPALQPQATPQPYIAYQRTPVRERQVEALAGVHASLPNAPDINFLDDN